MKKEEILEGIDDCMLRCDAKGLADNVDELLKVLKQEEACYELANRLFARYTTYKADSTAKLMEVIIRQKPRLAMLKFPENDMFRAAILRGSMDLYECYIQEAIEPFLKGKSEGKSLECYVDLSLVAEKLVEEFFPEYVRCVKGMDFNGAYMRSVDNPNAVLINHEDYEIMDEVVEKYNTILGRRDILKDLIKRMEMA